MEKKKKIAIIFMLSLVIVGISSAFPNLYAPDEYYDEPMIGKNNAKVKIVAYIGPQEPFSKLWFMETKPLILSKYSRREVSITFVHAPLDFHEHEISMMKAAECAARQDAYLAYLRSLYKHQDQFKNITSEKRAVRKLFNIAENHGLDMEKFEECFNSKKTALEVQSDKNFAFGTLGIDGVPTFSINGEKIVGAQPFAAFKEVIDRHLND